MHRIGDVDPLFGGDHRPVTPVSCHEDIVVDLEVVRHIDVDVLAESDRQHGHIGVSNDSERRTAEVRSDSGLTVRSHRHEVDVLFDDVVEHLL